MTISRATFTTRVQVSALIIFAILGAGEVSPQSPAASETEGPWPTEWGPEENGVRAGLVALDGDVSLGRPILFRVAVENLGRRAVEFAFQPLHAHLSMSIERSDGSNVPDIVPSVQTGFGRPIVLNPGERTLLIEGLDIADTHLLTSPGTYKVQFRGYDGTYPNFDDDDDGGVRIPASNTVTIRVTDGPVKPSRLIARKLFDVSQTSGWRFELGKEGSVVPYGRSSAKGAEAEFWLGDRMLGDNHNILVWVTVSPSAVEPTSQEAQRGLIAEPIGRCPWGEVYLWSAGPAEEVSVIRALIATALTIEER